MLDTRLWLPKWPPTVFIALAAIFVVATWVPLAFIFNYTQVKHERPRIHLFQDMDNQPRLNPQASSSLFNDGRAMRQPAAGTVARGQVRDDDHLDRGYVVQPNPDAAADQPQVTAEYLPGFPDSVEVDDLFLARGREKFNTFCYPCHGKGGYGNGPINERALQLMNGDASRSLGTSWVASANLQDVVDGKLKYGPELYPDGKLYKVIDQGQGNMAGYGHAIPVYDRWAIVAYVRALQLSQNVEAAVAAMDAADPNSPALAEKPE